MGLNGVMLPEVAALEAQFETDWRTDSDIALAKSVFTFRGLAIYENGQPVEPTYRISVFDSELAQLKHGWTDEDTEIVVDALHNQGPIGQMYVEVLPVAAEKPWTGYDELDVRIQPKMALGVESGCRDGRSAGFGGLLGADRRRSQARGD